MKDKEIRWRHVNVDEKAWFKVTVVETTNQDGEEIYTYYPVDWRMPLPLPPEETNSEIKHPDIPMDSGVIDIERIEVD